MDEMGPNLGHVSHDRPSPLRGTRLRKPAVLGGGSKMSILRIQTLAGVLATLFISPANAGQCSQDIHETMLAVASRLAEMALEAHTSPETRYATMHRQPTPYTIAQAE